MHVHRWVDLISQLSMLMVVVGEQIGGRRLLLLQLKLLLLTRKRSRPGSFIRIRQHSTWHCLLNFLRDSHRPSYSKQEALPK